MCFRRGLIAGCCWGLIGLVGVSIAIASFTFDSARDFQSNLAWWRLHAFPGIVFIPMLLFFTATVTYMPTRRVAFAKNLSILAATAFPAAILLGTLGMAHPRLKSVDHPPMYASEVLMFLIPLLVVSFALITVRSDPLPEDSSTKTDSQPAP